MNCFKCPACGGNQYTACGTAEGCIYCGHKELERRVDDGRRTKMSRISPAERRTPQQKIADDVEHGLIELLDDSSKFMRKVGYWVLGLSVLYIAYHLIRWILS